MNADKQGGNGKRRTVIRLFSFILLALATLCVLTYPIYPSLTIRDSRSNHIVWSGPIAENGTFGIRWTHSIHRSTVEELYHIQGGQVILSEMGFHDYGIGMENELSEGEELVIRDGQFRILHMNRAFPALHLFIGQVRANHTLLFAGQELPLGSMDEPGSAISIQAESLSILSKLGGD